MLPPLKKGVLSELGRGLKFLGDTFLQNIANNFRIVSQLRPRLHSCPGLCVAEYGATVQQVMHYSTSFPCIWTEYSACSLFKLSAASASRRKHQSRSDRNVEALVSEARGCQAE